MRRFPTALWMLSLVFAPALAAGGEIDLEVERKAFEEKVQAELRAIDPEAATLFAAGTAAREQGEHAAAVDLYAQAGRLAPSSAHPVRRQASEQLALGHRAEALALARQAVVLADEPANLSVLALALARRGDGAAPTAGELAEARRLALRAFEASPDDYWAVMTLCQVGVLSEDLDLLQKGTPRLLTLAPRQMETHIVAALTAGLEGSPEAAKCSLERARQLGLPQDQYRRLVAELAPPRPWWLRVLGPLGWALAGWALALGGLFVAGAVLSRLTLAKAAEISGRPRGELAGFELALRRAYRGVLWLCCAAYWLSLPFVALLVVGVFGGVVLLMLQVGFVFIKLLLIAGVLGLSTLAGMLKSLWVRASDEDPGVKLDLARDAPGLRTVLGEVAATIGTRPVDNVYLTAGTDLAVLERGGLWKQTMGASERCLILGLGVVEGLKLRPFRAILAHEYGHFSNRDTAGGGLALAVRRSLFTMALRVAEGGAAGWYNPAWLFIQGYHRLFLRISQGASRLQEILADRWAALGFGSKSFEEGLLHVIRRDLDFRAHVEATLTELDARKLPLANLYAYEPATERAEAYQKAIHAHPSPYDSHPAPVTRLLLVKKLAAAGPPPAADDEEPVWGLFRDRGALEERFSRLVSDRLGWQHEAPAPAG